MKTTLLLDDVILNNVLRHLLTAVCEDINYLSHYNYRPYDEVNNSIFDSIVDNLVTYNVVNPCSYFRSLRRIKRNLSL